MTYFDPLSSTWSWVQDKSPLNEKVKDEKLQALEQLFYFATARNFVTEVTRAIDLTITANRQQKCILTVDPTPEPQVDIFRQQELERYKMPEKPYIYVLNGVKSIVAPMKRGVGNPTNKPREHFLLKVDRPPHINLLCLVRDAAARLPGGVGTRPDVSLLLKDSQYVVETVTDGQINSVVSGALDRLHSESDPCVKFDPDQKLWVYPLNYTSAVNFDWVRYLHRHRTIADFSQRQTRGRRGGRTKMPAQLTSPTSPSLTSTSPVASVSAPVSPATPASSAPVTPIVVTPVVVVPVPAAPDSPVTLVTPATPATRLARVAPVAPVTLVTPTTPVSLASVTPAPVVPATHAAIPTPTAPIHHAAPTNVTPVVRGPSVMIQRLHTPGSAVIVQSPTYIAPTTAPAQVSPLVVPQPASSIHHDTHGHIQSRVHAPSSSAASSHMHSSTTDATAALLLLASRPLSHAKPPPTPNHAKPPPTLNHAKPPPTSNHTSLNYATATPVAPTSMTPIVRPPVHSPPATDPLAPSIHSYTAPITSFTPLPPFPVPVKTPTPTTNPPHGPNPPNQL